MIFVSLVASFHYAWVATCFLLLYLSQQVVPSVYLNYEAQTWNMALVFRSGYRFGHFAARMKGKVTFVAHYLIFRQFWAYYRAEPLAVLVTCEEGFFGSFFYLLHCEMVDLNADGGQNLYTMVH